MSRRFGDLLASERTARQLSQHRLAMLTGVTSSFISRLESSGREPSRETVVRLVAALDIPLDRADGQALLHAAGFATSDGAEAIYPEYGVVTRLHRMIGSDQLTENDRDLVIDAIDAIIMLAGSWDRQSHVIRVPTPMPVKRDEQGVD